jgi:predicted RNA-binding protein YlqC (UPF0109 family)
MSEIDQQFIEFVVKSLVGKPDAVQVKRTIDEKGVLLELTVDPEDLGRVIGKRGATAQSLRTLLRALGTKNDARYNLKIVDNGVGKPESAVRDTGSDAPASPRDETTDESAPENDDVSEPAAEVTDEEPETPAEESPQAEGQPEPEDNDEDDDASERRRKTREELADLDDLDV